MPPDPIHPLLFRHPVSAASHLLFALWAGFASGVLIRLARGDAVRHRSVAAFGVSAVFLYASSGLYHAVPADHPNLVGLFGLLDLSAIHVLIAGTLTAMAAPLGRRWRGGLLTAAWGLAAVGVLSKWVLPLPPSPVTIGLYVASAAVGLVALPPLGRAVGVRGVTWVVGGALVYA